MTIEEYYREMTDAADENYMIFYERACEIGIKLAASQVERMDIGESTAKDEAPYYYGGYAEAQDKLEQQKQAILKELKGDL